MFEMGFTELVLIGVIALLVVGPQRLPKLARSAGILFGKAQRTFNSVKADVSQELAADELKRALEKQAQASQSEMFEIFETTKDAVDAGSAQLEQATDAVAASSAKAHTADTESASRSASDADK